MTLLHLQVVDQYGRVWIAVVTSLAVALLLVTFFADRLVKAIFSKEGRVVLEQSKLFAILSTFKNVLNEISDAATPHEEEEGRYVGGTLFRVTKQRFIPPLQQMPVPGHTRGSGLMYAVTQYNVTSKGLAIIARGLMDVAPNRPFQVLLTNCSNHPIHVPKGMLVARGAGVPGKLFDVEKLQLEESNINVIHNKPVLSRETPRATARGVEKTYDQRVFDK